jgi:ACT domain-containing protein
MASMTMDEFKSAKKLTLSLVGYKKTALKFERLKTVSEEKKNFVIPKLRNAVASNSYVGWGI